RPVRGRKGFPSAPGPRGGGRAPAWHAGRGFGAAGRPRARRLPPARESPPIVPRYQAYLTALHLRTDPRVPPCAGGALRGSVRPLPARAQRERFQDPAAACQRPLRYHAPVHSERRRVVTAFVRRQERVLTVRRSDRVSSYRGKWAGISGYVGSGELPDDAALREVWGETGLFPGFLGGGLPLDVDDAETDRAWRVHPFLVAASADSEPRLDWEAAESRWVLPEELAALDTVPGLSEALARVWDPVAALPEPLRTAARALREDHVRGAAELAPQAWALAAQSPQHAELVAALRPTMAPVEAAARAAGRGQPFRPRIEQAVAAAVAVLRPALRVVTLSRSSTILAALARTPGPLHL